MREEKEEVELDRQLASFSLNLGPTAANLVVSLITPGLLEREAEVKMLDGGHATDEEAAQARDEIGRMKALLKELELEAAQGDGIQMDPRTAAPMDIGTYFAKSFSSLYVNRAANLGADGEAPALPTAVTFGLIAVFCLQLSGLLGLAFDPSRGT